MYLSVCLLNLFLVLLLWLNPDYPTNRRKKFLRKYFKKVIQRESFLRSKMECLKCKKEGRAK